MNEQKREIVEQQIKDLLARAMEPGASPPICIGSVWLAAELFAKLEKARQRTEQQAEDKDDA